MCHRAARVSANVGAHGASPAAIEAKPKNNSSEMRRITTVLVRRDFPVMGLSLDSGKPFHVAWGVRGSLYEGEGTSVVGVSPERQTGP